MPSIQAKLEQLAAELSTSVFSISLWKFQSILLFSTFWDALGSWFSLIFMA